MSAYGAHNAYGAYGSPGAAVTSNGFGILNPSPAERAYVQSMQKRTNLQPFPKEFLKPSGRTPFHLRPEQIIAAYMEEAQHSAGMLKNKLQELFKEHTEGGLTDDMRNEKIKEIRPYMDSAMKKSNLAMNKVPGIPLKDMVTIEDLIKTITEALKKEDTSVLDISIAMRYADDLEVMWEYYLENFNMEEIEKKLGSYAMGQMYGSAKGGKRTHRHRKNKRTNRKHKRTNRKHKRTHRKRK